ncbi:hypothetical protein K1719_019577 [Acacia pycnantha]|nr:hypothetical protein K1719_019577 [Acacia pycnantha]
MSPTLRDLKVEIKWKKKIAVCGPVGSGKSSLTYAIPGQIPKISGFDCVMTALRKKTVLLVTHQVEFLSYVDRILVMEGGVVTQSGCYEDLLTEGTAFEQLVNAHREAILGTGQNNEILGEFEDVINVFQPLESHGIHPSEDHNKTEIFSFKCSLSVAKIYHECTSWIKTSPSFFSGFDNSIFKALMLFFDSTPTGRILTRASSDLSTLDFDIPCALTFAAVYPFPHSLFVDFFFCLYFQASSRELMRINGTTKAPVIMNFASETSLGVVTVRAFNMADRFYQGHLKLVDTDAKILSL